MDDDDATANDDDASDDDDFTTPPEEPVDQAAHGAIVFVRFDGVEPGALIAGAFSDDVMSPSAEEGAFQENTEVTLPTVAPLDGYRDLAPGAYIGPFGLDADGVFGVVDGTSVALSESSDGVWSALNMSPAQIPERQSWTAQITGADPLAGFYDAAPMPVRPTLSGEGLIGPILFLKPGQGIDLVADPPPGREPDIFTLTGVGTPGRAWGSEDGTFVIPATDLPGLATNDAGFFHQRNARVRVEGDRSLVLLSGAWTVGEVVQLETTDVFLSPVDPEPGDVVSGQVLVFTPEPAIADVTQPYSLSIGGVSLPVTFSEGRLQVTVEDPTTLGSGWQNVAMDLPAGVARGAIRIGTPPPPCDLMEFGSNDALGGANPMAAGQVLCGVFESGGDLDFARFEGVFGASYEIQVWSDRTGSYANPQLQVLDETGAAYAVTGDTFGDDPRVEFTAPWTGTVFLRVDEAFSQFGPAYDWRLQVRPLP